MVDTGFSWGKGPMERSIVDISVRDPDRLPDRRLVFQQGEHGMGRIGA